jgi:haloalkane dehalogenase
MKLKDKCVWQEKVGNQRDWIWRGWRIRYSFQPQKSSCNKNYNIPIILLHGFGASLKHWRQNISVLSENHSVYALDLLGFGNSQKAYTNYGIELWSELVYDFWSHFIAQPSILIGNSIGSLIALNTVVNYSQIAKSLVMLALPDVAGRGEKIPPKLLPLILTIEKLVANPLLVRLLFYIARKPSIIRRSLKIAYVDHFHVDDELVNLISYPPRDKGAARALIALTKSMNSFSVSASELLQQVNIPMLLLWGKCDRLVPPHPAEKLAQVNPLIELRLLDNIGHCPHDESPEIFHQIVGKWLQVNS